ncbi:MAG TPA: alkane 1-monooxygenase [Xanthomonadales bacterium]|nr:alkane 1-monooxygenase [Xanthomonadales bacterium]
MRVYSLLDSDLGLIEYRDKKRWLWPLSLVLPLVPLLGVALYLQSAAEWMLAVPLAISYVMIPVLDWLLGVDTNNPPELLVPQLEADVYYRRLTYFTVPLHYLTLVLLAWFVATQDLSLWAILLLAITAGLFSGLGINTAHELGHKKTRLEQNLAKWALAVPAYGHFCVEHNRGHHRQVATPEDPASARMGESIYRFMLREIPGGWKRAWREESIRLERAGLPAWSRHNVILQSYTISAVLQLGLVIAFGWIMIPFLLVHNVFAWFQLTSANYIEHYGLLREKLPNGEYERCQPHHSWNANYIFSNLVLFHLERHSDHHANSNRRYQSLRHFEDIPQLPNGYFGCYLLAYVPWLWYRIMDPRLLALPHIQGDIRKINLDPGKRERLLAIHTA